MSLVCNFHDSRSLSSLLAVRKRVRVPVVTRDMGGPWMEPWPEHTAPAPPVPPKVYTFVRGPNVRPVNARPVNVRSRTFVYNHHLTKNPVRNPRKHQASYKICGDAR